MKTLFLQQQQRLLKKEGEAYYMAKTAKWEQSVLLLLSYFFANIVGGILLCACSTSTCCYRLKNFYFPSLPKSMSGGYFNSSFFTKETTFAAVVRQNCCLFSILFSKLLHKQNAFMGAIIFNVLGWTFKRIFAGQHFFFR